MANCLPWRRLVLGVMLLVGGSFYAQAATYNLPNGQLPTNCANLGVQANGRVLVQCNSNQIFGNNDTINVSTNTDWVISGDFTFNNGFSVNENAPTDRLNITVAGNMNPNNNAVINANMTIAGSINSANNSEFTGSLLISGNLNLGNNATVEGSITVTGVFQTGSNANITADIDATNVNIGQNSVITGNIDANNINIDQNVQITGDIEGTNVNINNGSVIDGNINATGTVNNNGTVTGYVNAPNVNDNGGGIEGPICDENQNQGACNGSASVAFWRLSHSGTALTCESYPVTVSACADTNCDTLAPVTGSVQVASVFGGFSPVTANFNNTGQAQINLAISNPGNDALTTANSTVTTNNPTQCTGANGCAVTAVTTALRFSGEAPQVAGQPFNLALQAIRTDQNTGACAAALNGNRTVELGYECENPGSCSAGAQLQVNDTAVNPNGSDVILNFDSNGQAQLPTRFADVGAIRLEAATSSPVTGASLVGLSQSFVVRPAALRVTALNNPAAGCAPADRNCFAESAPYVAAEAPFTVQVQALNSNGDVTPNFGLENTPEQVVVDTAELLAPSAAEDDCSPACLATGSVQGDSGWQRVGAGTWQSAEVRFSEIGVARLQADLLGDGQYLGSGVIPGNRSSAPIGRFVPAYFAILEQTDVQVATAQDDFTYFGQPTGFATVPELQLQPRGAQDGNLRNYVGDFMRLEVDTLSVLAREYTTELTALDEQIVVDDVTDTADVLLSGTEFARDGEGARVDLTVQWDDLEFLYVRPQAPLIPQLAELELTIGTPADGLFTDADGVCVRDTASADCQSIAFATTLAGATDLLYGSLGLEPSYQGLYDFPLPIAVRVDRYDEIAGGADWMVNDRDFSTEITPAWLAALDCGEETLTADIRAQDQPLLLTAGGSDNRFRVVGATAPCSALWELPQNVLENLEVEYLGPNNLRPELESEIIFNEVRRGHDRVISRRETGFGG